MLPADPFVIAIREFANGTMFLSALLLLFIFAVFCWKNRKSFLYNHTTQAAAAIAVLMAGHAVRSGSSWVEFMIAAQRLNLSNWFYWSPIWFLTATSLVIWGKVLMIYVFAPKKYCWYFIMIGIPLCLIIPALIMVTTR